ncbi:unnamed protein product [Mycena citricolor]|uniref:Uncharacterized protein n=2 Tax=Mycena citricolor TaxID=2018698 RepID=A0AAD2HQ94_9AGAR|nr:unnamed protein product [Mycena citricolor]
MGMGSDMYSTWAFSLGGVYVCLPRPRPRFGRFPPPRLRELPPRCTPPPLWLLRSLRFDAFDASGWSGGRRESWSGGPHHLAAVNGHMREGWSSSLHMTQPLIEPSYMSTLGLYRMAPAMYSSCLSISRSLSCSASDPNPGSMYTAMVAHSPSFL